MPDLTVSLITKTIREIESRTSELPFTATRYGYESLAQARKVAEK